jgi:hypothetical protein
MFTASLIPEAYYWARSAKHFDGKLTVVKVSTVFGEDPNYLTLALLGTDQHAMPCDFEIIGPLALPEENSLRQAAE